MRPETIGYLLSSIATNEQILKLYREQAINAQGLEIKYSTYMDIANKFIELCDTNNKTFAVIRQLIQNGSKEEATDGTY